MATTRRKFEDLIRRESDSVMQMLARKGLDYDESNDVTARLRQDAHVLGITAEQCVFTHVKKHPCSRCRKTD